ncbi:MAG: lamin tail domain-containing protein [Candidatus Methanomethylophilus sp.]|nr:lamin tail domain-containing protein [Methanomethylophilus sp.]MDD3232549.1 lamin tail domain-containing protein [Methanomethylophilus sp.]MDD4668284.1 lamin tail domain-containing protein [Methanomethylophilus sp.]
MTHGLHRNRRGSLPFAIVAVTILVVASAYGIVAGQLEETEQADSHIGTEIDAIGLTETATVRFVERGLGEILHTVSTDSTLGALESREEAFRALAAQWFAFQFPLADGGVHVDLHSYEVKLTVETLKLEGLTVGGDGCLPVYLQAAGTITASFASDSGRADAELTFCSDGSCGLPLAAAQGSLFEAALSGGGSLLAQLMTYELSSLAQYRVLNGYGALTSDGSKGTSQILTAEDAEQSYRSALSAVETLFFRNNADGTLIIGDTDPAKAFITGENGMAYIDLDALYSQALLSAVDDISTKWFDYFLGNALLRGLDMVTDTLANAWETLTSFITGRDPFSTADYIRDVLGSAADINIGIDETLTYSCDNRVFGYDYWMPDGIVLTSTVPYPTPDYLNSVTVTDFADNYEENTNRIRDLIYGIVREAADQAAGSSHLGTIAFNVYESSDPFNQIVADRLSEALTGSDALFAELAEDALGAETFPDPFTAALYNAIMQNQDALFCKGERFYRYLTDAIYADLAPKYAAVTDGYELGEDAKQCIYHDLLVNYHSAGDTWSDEVDTALTQLQALRDKEAEDSSILRQGFTAALKGGLLVVGHGVDIKSRMGQLCHEELAQLDMNPFDGVTAFPDEDAFRVTDTGGNTVAESLYVKDYSVPSIQIGYPADNQSLCTHQTGFRDSAGAAYCSMFTVSLTDTLPYTVTSTGGLTAALGISDAAVSGQAVVSLDLQIPVISGWELAGVPSYDPTVTVLDDLQAAALKALEPIIEPLRKAMALAQELLDRLKEALSQAGRWAADRLAKVYAAISEPLEALADLIESEITDAAGNAILAAAEKIAVTVDANAKHQIFGFNYLGTTVTLTFNAASLVKTTKQVVKAELDTDLNGTAVHTWLNVKVKEKSDGGPRAVITGGLSLTGDGWTVTGDVDPLMLSSEHLLTVTGDVNGTGIDLVLPDLIQYREANLCLSDVPALETVLSSLPSPIAGTKLIVDAGLELKYAAPFESGVLVNEFESNPAGEDTDCEWAEILNATRTAVDLESWTLTTSKGRTYTFGAETLAAGARTSVEFDGTFLVNSNEYLVLKDAAGTEQDRTPARSDGGNDDRTWQRGADTSVEWVLAEGTRDEQNRGGLIGTDGLLTSAAISIFGSAASRAMGEMKQLGSVAELGNFFKLTVQYALDDGIDGLAFCLVEAGIFVSADAADLTGTARTGLRLALYAGEEMAGDLLRYVVGRCEELFLNIDDPYAIDLGQAVPEDLYVGMTVYTGIAPPTFLGDVSDLPDVRLGIDVAANISAFARICGQEMGDPAVTAGIRIIGCPTSLVPSALNPDKTMESDLWLMRLTITPDG